MAEAFGKRRYPKHFTSKLTDSISENYETQTWLQFALAEDYIDEKSYAKLINESEEVGRLLSYMVANPAKFIPARYLHPSKAPTR